MLSSHWAPSETDGLIYARGVEGGHRDQDLSEAPESSQEGPPILPGEGGVILGTGGRLMRRLQRLEGQVR